MSFIRFCAMRGFGEYVFAVHTSFSEANTYDRTKQTTILQRDYCHAKLCIIGLEHQLYTRTKSDTHTGAPSEGDNDDYVHYGEIDRSMAIVIVLTGGQVKRRHPCVVCAIEPHVKERDRPHYVRQFR